MNRPTHRHPRSCRGTGRALAAGLLASGLFMSGATARVPEIVAFGDSLTSGFGLPPNEGFPAQLQARLKMVGVSAHVENLSQAGDTTSDGLARLDWTLTGKPDLVILELGANDMLRGIDPKVVRDNLDKMLARIRAKGVRVLLAGMRSSANWGADYQQHFDHIYPVLARAYGVTLYPFFLEGVAMDPKLTQPDGLHPNKQGVAVVVDHIAPVVAKLIGGRS